MKRSDISVSRERALKILKMAMVEKKLTQNQLADASDCHEKTIQNLLSGRSVRDQTLFDVCMVLDLDFDDVKHSWKGSTGDDGTAGLLDLPMDQPEAFVDDEARPVSTAHEVPGVAALYMGGYTLRAVDHYIGNYLTVRPAFDGGPDIIAYQTQVFWSELANALCFREQDRPDAAYSHRGHLYIPSSSMFIHLVSLTKGAMRMVLVSQIDQFGIMRGIITTLNKAVGSAFTPVATPIIYERCEDIGRNAFGAISPGDKNFARYSELLDETTQQSYVRLLGQRG